MGTALVAGIYFVRALPFLLGAAVALQAWHVLRSPLKYYNVLKAGVIGAIVGGVGATFIGVIGGCLWYRTNLCGLFGIFVTGPLGGLVGLAVGALVGLRQRQRIT